MGLTKKEAQRIWHMANAFQIQMYAQTMPHIKALEKLYGDKSADVVSKWIEESVEENNELNCIKAKMQEIINKEVEE